MIRNAVAVIAGFVLWTALWLSSNAIVKRLMPEAFEPDGVVVSSGIMAGFVVLSFLYSLFAGYTTASIARTGRMKAAWALAVIQLAVGIFVESRYWDSLPLWYHAWFLILLVPGIIIGARIRAGRPAPGGVEPGRTP